MIRKKHLTTEAKVALALLIVAVVGVVIYFLRARSKAFRDTMDKVLPTPLNPFAMANIVLSAAHEAYVKNLHPAEQWRFRAFIKECEQEGWTIICTSGYRDWASQYKQWKANPSNAKPGKSHHNYGLALDLNASKGGTYLRKSSSEKAWLDSGIPAIAKRHGLTWQYKFGTYKDPIHFYVKYDTSKLLAQGKAQFGSEDKIIGNQVKLTA